MFFEFYMYTCSESSFGSFLHIQIKESCGTITARKEWLYQTVDRFCPLTLLAQGKGLFLFLRNHCDNKIFLLFAFFEFFYKFPIYIAIVNIGRYL